MSPRFHRLKATLLTVGALRSMRCVLLLVAVQPSLGAQIATKSTQSGWPVPLKSEITQVQPMTGLVLWQNNHRAKALADTISLEYRYCGYNEVVNESGQFDFSSIDQWLDDIASRNHQAILRFYFCYVGKETTVPDFIRDRFDYHGTVGLSEGKRTHFCDWSDSALQEFTLEFYKQFAARYDSDPRLAFLQTGFGLWGEYHIYDGPFELGRTFPSRRFQAKFLQHLEQQFSHLPWSISVDAADYDYSPLEGNQELLGLSFGLFDDSFLCKQHADVNALNWKMLGSQRWQRAPAGGEFSYYNKRDQKEALSRPGPNGVPFEKAAKQYHISYMIGNDQPRYQDARRILSASMATGYRFEVTRATLQGQTLELSVVNSGVAPIYRDAYFQAGDKRSHQSLRGLLPGQSLNCEIAAVAKADCLNVSISSDAILPTQQIQFIANLQ